VSNNLAYYDAAKVTAVKGFIVQALVLANVVKMFRFRLTQIELKF